MDWTVTRFQLYWKPEASQCTKSFFDLAENRCLCARARMKWMYFVLMFLLLYFFFVKLSCLYSTECHKQRELCTVQKKWTNLKLKRKKVAFLFIFFVVHIYTFSYHYKCVNVLGALFFLYISFSCRCTAVWSVVQFIFHAAVYVLLFKELNELRKPLMQ